ncbi:MAG: DUF4430 domain-containing protein [Eggerthellaceae bacterium]|jgi:hypothetical protein
MKKKNRALNIAMAVLIAVIVVAGVLFALNMRGTFETAQDTAYAAADKSGNANITRDGIGYRLDEGTVLQVGDNVETLSGSTITLKGDSHGSAALDESTVLDARSDCLEFESGSAFCQVAPDQGLSLKTSQMQASSTDGVFVLEAGTGTTSIYVLAGTVTMQDGTTLTAGQTATYTDGKDAPDVQQSYSLGRFDDFMLERTAAALKDGKGLCFTAKQVAKQQKKRANEKGASSGKPASVATDAAKSSAGSSSAANNEDTAASGSTSSSFAAGATANGGTAQGTSSGNAGGSAAKAGKSGGSSASAAKAATRTVTIQIRCDTILKHKKQLASGKLKYVPSNGVILGTTTVAVSKGDTVFDVLKAVCDDRGIQLEYSYAPVYETNYIEGINNLYQKDCGDQSGWVYKVNGWSPNVGCSQYKVKNGDRIVWSYTCENYGEDVD